MGSRSADTVSWHEWLRWQLPLVAFACAYFPVTAARRTFMTNVYGSVDPLSRRARDKWGWLPAAVRERASRCSPVWIDMTSGGEFIQSRSLLRELGVDGDGWVLSTNGYDSYRALVNLYGEDKVIFTPWDIGGVVSRVLDAVRPRAVVLVLGPYFPMLLRAARRRGIRTLLVNGLLGRNARAANPVMERAIAFGVHREVDAFSVQAEEDRDILRTMGVPAERIEVTGNLATDLLPSRLSRDARCQLRASLGMKPDDPVVIFGSTHEGETDLIRTVIAFVRRQMPRSRFIVAPRQLHHVAPIERVLRATGLRVGRSSDETRDRACDVVLCDVFGELLALYGAADVAYIGSTLVPINARRGGHNPLEPLVHGTVPLFGPHLSLWRSAAERLRRAWPQIEVDGAETLAARVVDVLGGRAPAAAVREAGDELLRASSGAVQRTADFVRRELAIGGAGGLA